MEGGRGGGRSRLGIYARTPLPTHISSFHKPKGRSTGSHGWCILTHGTEEGSQYRQGHEITPGKAENTEERQVKCVYSGSRMARRSSPGSDDSGQHNAETNWFADPPPPPRALSLSPPHPAQPLAHRLDFIPIIYRYLVELCGLRTCFSRWYVREG